MRDMETEARHCGKDCLKVIQDILAILCYKNKGNLIRIVGFLSFLTFTLLVYLVPRKWSPNGTNFENETDDLYIRLNDSNALKYYLRVCETTDVNELVNTDKFLYSSCVIAAFITGVLMFVNKRQTLNTSRFRWLQLVYPINMLEEQENRQVYAAAFSVNAWTMLNLLLGNTPFYWVSSVLYKILACILYRFSISPLLSGLTSNNLVGYILAAIYSWIIAVAYTIDFFPCSENDHKLSVLILIRSMMFLPLGFSMLFVSITLTYKAIRTTIYTIRSNKSRTIQLIDEPVKFETEYVCQLFRETYKYRLHEGQKANSIFNKIYRRQPEYMHLSGFRYNQSIITATWLSAMTIYLLALSFFYKWWSVIYVTGAENLSNLKSFIMNQHPYLEDFIKSFALSERLTVVVVRELGYLISVHEECCILSIVIALFVSYLSLFIGLKNYRFHMKELFRGDHSSVPIFKKPSPRSVLLSSVRYVGYHVGYASWGFVIQATVTNIVVSLIAIVVILTRRYNINTYLLDVLLWLWPVFLLGLVVVTVQHLLVHFFFLQRLGGNLVLALDNRHLFFNFQYYMVFVNMAVGLVASLVRMFMSLALGLWIVPRLDMSTLNRHFERLDAGFSSYVCMLNVQNVQTNPVMVSFVHILLKSVSLSKKKKVFALTNIVNVSNDLPDNIVSRGSDNLTTSKRCRNRWLLYLTLNRNAGLIKCRKWSLQLMKAT